MKRLSYLSGWHFCHGTDSPRNYGKNSTVFERRAKRLSHLITCHSADETLDALHCTMTKGIIDYLDSEKTR